MTTSLQAPQSRAPITRQRDLHPVLSAALSSLDVNLEAELTRYQLARCDALIHQQDASPETLALITIPKESHAIAGNPAEAAIQGLDNPFSAALLDGLNTTVLRDTASPAPTDGPQTYLASSEELLRSLDGPDDELSPHQKGRLPRVLERWNMALLALTPLSVGLMILVGLSSLMATSLALNARSGASDQQSEAAATPPSDPPLSSLSPDLTVGEFARLNLNRLITLSPRPNRAKTKPALEPREELRPTADTPTAGTPFSAPPYGAPANAPLNRARTAAPAPVPAPQQSPPPAPAAPPALSAPAPIAATAPEADLPVTAPVRPRRTSKTQPSAAVATPETSAATPPAAAPVPAVPIEPPTPVDEPRAEPEIPELLAPETPAATAPAPEVAAPSLPPLDTSAPTVDQPVPPVTRPQSSNAAPSSTPSSATPPAEASQNSRETGSASPAATSPAYSTPDAPAPDISIPDVPAPDVLPPAPLPREAPSSEATGDYHHVVTPYTGDRSLEAAREAVSGAYLRNSPAGAQVQFGAFESEDAAQQLVDQLSEQGIDATIDPE